MSYSSEKGYKKYKKYLYCGILNGAVAIAMLVVTIIFKIRHDALVPQVFGYLAALTWSVVAYLLIRVYFIEKKAEEERLEVKDTTL